MADVQALREDLESFRKSPEYGVFQLNEYVQAFRASSDRARYVIFITTAVSLLMLIAAWNYHRWSWSRRATDKYYEYRAEEQQGRRRQLLKAAASRNQIDAILTRLQTTSIAPADAAELRQAVLEAERVQRSETIDEALATRLSAKQWGDHQESLEWYQGQAAEFYSRGIFVPVPGLGASLHVNDMAIIGGLVLLALTALLWVSLIRQHENLYLSLFKIDLIRTLEGKSARKGDSLSNLLYHSLAMGQVLSHPPTLARWNTRIRQRIVHFCGSFVVYFLPGVVHGGIVVQNILSRERAYRVWREYTYLRLGVQVLLAILILTFCALAFTYARSCERRWRKAFFQINRSLRRIEQRPWAEWVGLSEGHIASKDLRRLARDLTYEMDILTVGNQQVRERTSYRERPGSALDMRKHAPSLFGALGCLVEMLRRSIGSPRIVITQREMTKAVKDLYTHVTGEQDGRSSIRLRNTVIEKNQLMMHGNGVASWKVRIKSKVETPLP
jgi:hypothetical protein